MSIDVKEAYVRTELHNGVATIEFFHPQSNALPAQLLDELEQAFHSASHDAEVKVILLRSGGDKAFCAGAAFDELAAIKNEEEGTAFFTGFAKVINAMRTSSKMIVARVHGKCVGGGVGLVAAADYAIACEAAEVKLSELAIGIGPFVVGPAVERKVGLSAFSQLAIDATMWRNGDWARRKGLFAELHPTVEGMDESIARLIYTLSHSSKEAMAELRKITWAGTEHWDKLLFERAAISGRLILSEFSRKAIESLRKK